MSSLVERSAISNDRALPAALPGELSLKLHTATLKTLPDGCGDAPSTSHPITETRWIGLHCHVDRLRRRDQGLRMLAFPIVPVPSLTDHGQLLYRLNALRGVLNNIPSITTNQRAHFLERLRTRKEHGLLSQCLAKELLALHLFVAHVRHQIEQAIEYCLVPTNPHERHLNSHLVQILQSIPHGLTPSLWVKAYPALGHCYDLFHWTKTVNVQAR